MHRIRILTYQRAINNGAILQAYALSNHLKKRHPGSDVKLIDYVPLALEAYEFAKLFKLHKRAPFFNFSRFVTIRNAAFKNMDMDDSINSFCSYDSLVTQLEEMDIHTLVVGSDCIWKLSDDPFLPSFPNIYWLSDRMSCKKISYAASAYQYDPRLGKRHSDTIGRLVNTYDLVSVRDEDTARLLSGCGVTKKIARIPDPAFLYEPRKTGVEKKFARRGVGTDKPVCAVLSYGRNEEIERLCRVLKRMGYQTVGLSMYNPYVDVNLGHELDPFEWADAFRHVKLCFTDRFHGAVFCLKSETPFIAMETEGVSKDRSKKYQLVTDFGIEECYMNLKSPEKAQLNIELYAQELLENWQSVTVPRIRAGLEKINARSGAFHELMDEVIEAE